MENSFRSCEVSQIWIVYKKTEVILQSTADFLIREAGRFSKLIGRSFGTCLFVFPAFRMRRILFAHNKKPDNLPCDIWLTHNPYNRKKQKTPETDTPVSDVSFICCISLKPAKPPMYQKYPRKFTQELQD